MKQVIFEKPYQPFLLTGLLIFCVAIFIRGAYPDSLFEVSIYNTDYSALMSRIWFGFAGYLFFLALVYYIVFRNSLRTKKWLVVLHYVFVALFLAMFTLFSIFPSPAMQKTVRGIPLTTLITIYGIIFLADVLLFISGILLLIINLFSLKQ
jgi:hypothetical protein